MLAKFARNISLAVLACVLLLIIGYLNAQNRPARNPQGQAQNQPRQAQDPPESRLPAEVDTGESYLPVVVPPFEEAYQKDVAERDQVLQEQKQLLEARYDLSDNPSDVWMSGKRLRVQQGVRAKLPEGVTWQALSEKTPAEIKQDKLWPMGFRPLPHVKQNPGGMVIHPEHIKEIQKQEKRDLDRFDAKFDLPVHLLPEFPPPMFLTNRPDLGDVTGG